MLHLHQCNEKQRKKKKENQKKASTIENEPKVSDVNDAEAKLYNQNVEMKFNNEKNKYNVKKIDNAAFYVTSSLYLTFNIAYWATFLISDPD